MYDINNSPEINNYINTLYWLDASMQELSDDITKDYPSFIIHDVSKKSPGQTNCLKLRISNLDRHENYLLYYSKNMRGIKVYDQDYKQKYQFIYSIKDGICYKLIYDITKELCLTYPSQEQLDNTDYQSDEDVCNDDLVKLFFSLSVPITLNDASKISNIHFRIYEKMKSENIFSLIGLPAEASDFDDDEFNQTPLKPDSLVELSGAFIRSSIVQNMETIKEHFLKLRRSQPNRGLSDSYTEPIL